MVKKGGAAREGRSSQEAVERIAQPLALEMGLELVEVTLQKESRGQCLCIYLDKEEGLTLDDCEGYHKRVQPLLEHLDYDFLEVSSPGADRPVKTARDIAKNLGKRVDVRLFAPLEGSKAYQGTLQAMDEKAVTLLMDSGQPRQFLRKAVALVRPVIFLEGLEGEEDL